MEQHIENVFKSHKSRLFRSKQLENEMAKVDLSRDTQYQMRKMLSKRESNYIRLRRAKMDRAMFTKIKVSTLSSPKKGKAIRRDRLFVDM